MASTPAALLAEALRLPDDERETLALALLDSVHGPGDEGDVDAAWRTEIERRIADMRAGRSQGRPWAAVEADIRARLRTA